MLKHLTPFILLFTLLALSLCTRQESEGLSLEEEAQIETIDSVATELEASIESIEANTDQAEESIDALLNEVEGASN